MTSDFSCFHIQTNKQIGYSHTVPVTRNKVKNLLYTTVQFRCFPHIRCSTNCRWENRTNRASGRGQATSVRTIHDDFGTPSCRGAPFNPGRELEGACAGDPKQTGPVPGAAGIGGGLADGYRFEQAAGAMVGSGLCLRLVIVN
jgi:hypothetical protein